MTELEMMEVRCCCDASKVLGWLPAPGSNQRMVFALGRSFSDRAELPETSTLEVAKVFNALSNPPIGLAYKNPDLPIETLRRIPSFVEKK